MAEITDRESFEIWLKGQPKEWAQVLAMRSALRVLPLVGESFDSKSLKLKDQKEPFFQNFHGSVISWSARKYPNLDLTEAADRAVDFVSAASTFVALAVASAIKATAADSTFSDIAAKAAVADADATLVVFAEYAAELAVITATTTVSAAIAAVDPVAAKFIVDAADDIWKAINRDARFLEAQKSEPEISAKALAERALWLNDDGKNTTPEWVLGAHKTLEQLLSGLNDNWLVWIEWYRSRLEGKESWSLSEDNAETLMLRIASQKNGWWKLGPSIVNVEIAKWLAEMRADEAREEFSLDELPAIPPQGPGLKYGLPKGKLSASGSHPLADEAEDQVSLHNRVKAKADKLNDLMLTTGNQYPELAEAVKEYLELLNQSIDQIDVDGLWSVGGALFELKEAYAKQNHPKTMSVALEPPETAALSGLCRDHGALILGFERGAELVERADRFARNAQLVLEITEPSKPVLAKLTNNRDLVEDETRKLHKPILDA